MKALTFIALLALLSFAYADQFTVEIHGADITNGVLNASDVRVGYGSAAPLSAAAVPNVVVGNIWSGATSPINDFFGGLDSFVRGSTWGIAHLIIVILILLIGIIYEYWRENRMTALAFICLVLILYLLATYAGGLVL